jgi:hypothetical protein
VAWLASAIVKLTATGPESELSSARRIRLSMTRLASCRRWQPGFTRK